MNETLAYFINLVILSILGIIYLLTFIRSKKRYLEKLIGGNNRSTFILLISGLLSASINLYNITEAISDAIIYFVKIDYYLKAMTYAFSFTVSSWIFSMLLFKYSFFIVGLITEENEKNELINDNYRLALLHGVILTSLSLIISPAIVKIAISFIPYPNLPF
jgi:hypothetical protein